MGKSRSLRNYLQENLALYLFVSVLFVMGVIFGALLVNALSAGQRQDISGFLGSFLHMMRQAPDPGAAYPFIQSFTTNLRWLVLIWLFGLSVVGLPLILLLDFLKGVLIGFTVGYLVGDLSWSGVWFALFAIAPQNLVMIPVLLIASVLGITFSIQFVRTRLLNKKQTPPSFLTFTLQITVMIVISAVVALYETTVTPHLIRWATPFILG